MASVHICLLKPGVVMQFENTTPFAADLNFAFEKSGRELVVVAVKATFDFPEQGAIATPAQEQLPLFYSEVFGDDPEADAVRFDNDFAPVKRACDVLCEAVAFSPGGRPTKNLKVGMRLGQWSKAFDVIGPRIWLRGAMGHRISDTRPFTKLSLSYDNAWGGVDPHPEKQGHAATCETNPSGVGYYPYRLSLEGAPLPLTYQPNRHVTDIDGPYLPMAFGPVGRHWLPRRKYVGTYDQVWMDHRMPFMPDDFDPMYYQSAPPDQQISFPKGGEPVELLNLTVEGRFGFYLPRETLGVTFQRKSGPLSQKIPLLDTVQLLPAERRFCLTWRTRFACNRDIHDLSEIIVTRRSE